MLQRFSNLPSVLLTLVLLRSACVLAVETTTADTTPPGPSPPATSTEVKTKQNDSEFPTTPTESTSEDTASSESTSEDTASSESTSEDTAPSESTSEDTSSEYTVTSSYTTSAQEFRLTETVCASTDNLTGHFENFENFESSPLSSTNEGDDVTVVCKMKNIAGCQRFLSSLVNSTQLYMQHPEHKTIPEDEVLDYKSKNILRDSEDTYLFSIEFNFTLIHAKHDQGSVYCRASNDNGSLVVVSPKKDIRKLNKKYHVKLTPLEVDTEIGSMFQLTCTVNDAEGFQYLEWVKKSPSFPAYTSVDESLKKKVGELTSVLTIKEMEEWKGTYKCTIDNVNSGYKLASVVVRAKDRRAVHGTTITLSIIAVLVIILVVVLIIRRRALKKKIEISMMLMELQEANTNAQHAAREGLGSVHSLVMEPAVNCYASNSINPDGSLGQETLTATFARFTNMYAHWQKDRTTLVIKNVLGEGNFGSVCLGIMPDVYLQGISSQVAVKTIKPARMDRQAIMEFEKEVSIMTSLRHDNIVSLVGLCTETMPLYIIMEYMENGPLNSFLMDKAPNKLEDTSLSTQDLLFIGLQPCRALEYLSNKNIVHRDISARNCLVGAKLEVKLADFGLSRGTAVDDGKNYYKKDGGMVPVKWMAPEALNFGKYTTANDVWAFGVLMWEIFSFGAIPYQSHSNQQVIVFVNRGGRLEKPDYCPQSIWQHICLCWTQAPEDRLTIGGLVNMLSTELDIFISCDSSNA